MVLFEDDLETAESRAGAQVKLRKNFIGREHMKWKKQKKQRS
jgi:hypothetical protein